MGKIKQPAVVPLVVPQSPIPEQKPRFQSGIQFPVEFSGRERLVSELLTPAGIARKTRIPNPFNQAALEMLAYYFATTTEKKALLDHWGVGKEMADKPQDIGALMYGWIQAYDNAAIAKDGMRVMEYIAALTGLGPSMEGEGAMKNRRPLETVVGA